MRRLGRSIDFETSFGALGTHEAVVVIGEAAAFEELATSEPIEVFFLRTLPRRGVVVPLGRFDTLLDTGKDEEDFLEIAGSRLSVVGEFCSQILGPGAERGAHGDNLGLTAVVSEILMKLPSLISFSCVFLGAGGALAGDDFIPQRFTGFGVASSFRPA